MGLFFLCYVQQNLPYIFVCSQRSHLNLLFSFRQFAQPNTQRVCHPLAVRPIGLQAVADMADLDLHGSIAHGPGGVGEKHLLLLGTHQADEGTGLGVVIVVLAMVPVIGGALDAERRFCEVRLLLPLAVTVRFVAKRAAVVAVDPHGTVAMVVVERAAVEAVHVSVRVRNAPVAHGDGERG